MPLAHSVCVMEDVGVEKRVTLCVLTAQRVTVGDGVVEGQLEVLTVRLLVPLAPLLPEPLPL